MAGQSTGGGAAGTQTIDIGLPPGILLAATAFVTDATVLPGSTYITMAIVEGGDDLDNTIRLLADGYCTINSPVMWQGIHSVRSGQIIRAFIDSSALPVVKVQEVRLTPQNIGDLGKYIKSVIV